MMDIKDEDFEDLEHYREMFALIRDNTDEIVEMYKKNTSEIEVGFLLGKLHALASNKHVAMLNTLHEIQE